MKTCLLCKDEFLSSLDLTLHTTRNHPKLTKEKIVLSYKYGGIVPKCNCGCGLDLRWDRKKNDYEKFLTNHRKKITTKKFADKGKKIHNGKYGYDRVIISNDMDNKDKVEILCLKCQTYFRQAIQAHLKGSGCPTCGSEKAKTAQVKGLEEFLKQASRLHQTLDYSEAVYVNNNTNIVVLCKRCLTKFQITPHNNLDGYGCRQCKKNDLIIANSEQKTKLFIQKAKTKHGEHFDYSKVVYLGNRKKVIIGCPKCKKDFLQAPINHLAGNGCYRCRHVGKISLMENVWLDQLKIPKENRQIQLPTGHWADALYQNTVYEFLGDYWHGNPKVYPSDEINKTNKLSFGNLYQKTLSRIELIKSAGYEFVFIWESDWLKTNPKPKR